MFSSFFYSFSVLVRKGKIEYNWNFPHIGNRNQQISKQKGSPNPKSGVRPKSVTRSELTSAVLGYFMRGTYCKLSPDLMD